jgi:hypothetical protein
LEFDRTEQDIIERLIARSDLMGGPRWGRDPPVVIAKSLPAAKPMC